MRTTRFIRHRRGGWLLAETVVSVSLMLLLMGGLAVAQSATRKVNALQLARLRCTAAAQAQLDSLCSTGAVMTPEGVARLWPQVRTELSLSDGQGQWQGLKLATVTARGMVEGKEVSVELSRYVDRPEGVAP